MFSSDERSIQDFYGQYPRSRNELTGPLLSQSEPQDENTASKFQTEQNLRESEMKRNLLHELLDWVRKVIFRNVTQLPSPTPTLASIGVYFKLVGTLSKPRRQRQRERHKTKGLMSRTIAVHVRYNSWCIS